MICKHPELGNYIDNGFQEDNQYAVNENFIVLPEIKKNKEKAGSKEQQNWKMKILAYPDFPDIFQDMFYTFPVKVPDWKDRCGEISGIVLLIIIMCIYHPEPYYQ